LNIFVLLNLFNFCFNFSWHITLLFCIINVSLSNSISFNFHLASNCQLSSLNNSRSSIQILRWSRHFRYKSNSFDYTLCRIISCFTAFISSKITIRLAKLHFTISSYTQMTLWWTELHKIDCTLL
jgi:hypothetical protein